MMWKKSSIEKIRIIMTDFSNVLGRPVINHRKSCHQCGSTKLKYPDDVPEEEQLFCSTDCIISYAYNAAEDELNKEND